MSRASDLAGFVPAIYPIDNLNVGIVTADIYYGDGSQLSGISAGNSSSSEYALVSGFSTTSGYAQVAGFSTSSNYALVAGFSTSSGYAQVAGVSTSSNYAETSGIATSSNYALVSGFSTSSNYALVSGFSTSSNYALVSGFSTTSGYAQVAGVSTSSGYAQVAGVSTSSNYALVAGFSTSSGYAQVAGVSTSSNYADISGIATNAQGLTGIPNIEVGIITTTSIEATGIITASGSLTAGGLTYPTTNGTSGQVLTSDGMGNVNWSNSGGSSVNQYSGKLIDIHDNEVVIKGGGGGMSYVLSKPVITDLIDNQTADAFLKSQASWYLLGTGGERYSKTEGGFRSVTPDTGIGKTKTFIAALNPPNIYLPYTFDIDCTVGSILTLNFKLIIPSNTSRDTISISNDSETFGVIPLCPDEESFTTFLNTGSSVEPCVWSYYQAGFLLTEENYNALKVAVYMTAAESSTSQPYLVLQNWRIAPPADTLVLATLPKPVINITEPGRVAIIESDGPDITATIPNTNTKFTQAEWVFTNLTVGGEVKGITVLSTMGANENFTIPEDLYLRPTHQYEVKVRIIGTSPMSLSDFSDTVQFTLDPLIIDRTYQKDFIKESYRYSFYQIFKNTGKQHTVINEKYLISRTTPEGNNAEDTFPVRRWDGNHEYNWEEEFSMVNRDSSLQKTFTNIQSCKNYVVFFNTSNNSIWLSEDHGETYTLLPDPTGNVTNGSWGGRVRQISVATYLGNPVLFGFSTRYVDNKQEQYISTDLGDSWSIIDSDIFDNLGYSTSNYEWQLLSNDTTITLYPRPINFSTDTLAIFYSNDGGETWGTKQSSEILVEDTTGMHSRRYYEALRTGDMAVIGNTFIWWPSNFRQVTGEQNLAYTTTDGITWNTLLLPAEFQFTSNRPNLLQVDENETIYFINSSFRAVMYSIDGLQTINTTSSSLIKDPDLGNYMQYKGNLIIYSGENQNNDWPNYSCCFNLNYSMSRQAEINLLVEPD